MLHLRGPKLIGGALFSFTTIVSQCYPFVSLYFYRRSSIEDKTDPDMLSSAFTFLAIMWLACAVAFLRVTKSEFYHTFTQTITGWQFTIDSFRRSDDPETKMLTVFDNHSSFTESIKDEVIAYMRDNWAEWERTEPAWFTPKFIASVGDEFIPSRNLQQLNDTAVAEGKAEREKQKPTNLSSIKEIVITLSTVELLSDIYVSAKYNVRKNTKNPTSSNPTKSPTFR